MNQSLNPAAPDGVIFTDIKSEQIRIIFAAVPLSLLSILINSTILTVVLRSVIDSIPLFAWFTITNCFSLYRWFYYRRFTKLDPDRVIDHSWHRRAVITSALSGATWGAAGIFLFAENNIVHQVFLGFVISGMCAGGITTLSSILNAARGFVVLATLPIIFQFMLIDTEIGNAMTLMSLLFMTMILISAKRLNTAFTDTLAIRHEREIAQQTIRHQALYDSLTELPNRRLLLATLKQEIASANRHKHYGAIFFIDLDRFKSINDAMGHRVGDELLVQSALRIQSRLREADTIARLGGDEFVILLPEIGNNTEQAKLQALRVGDDIRNLFDKPFVIFGHEIHITVSIGISIFPLQQVGSDDLIQHADIAMYHAKHDGRDRVRLFSQEMQDRVDERQTTEKGLHRALANNEFELFYQPQFNQAHKIIGAEVLIRWNHPELGLVAPGGFIEVAEQTGLIVPIGDWVLRTACKQLANMEPGDIVISVNVSPVQFQDSGFFNRVIEILQQTNADPTRLKLEITEGMVMENVEQTIINMTRLKRFGISFSVDDFGTGYSSLAYLNRLPVDELKIDQSFVRDIANSADNAVIVETIIAMAQHLNLGIIAEGVETLAELSFLKTKDCASFQGFYFAKPAAYPEFIKLVERAAQAH